MALKKAAVLAASVLLALAGCTSSANNPTGGASPAGTTPANAGGGSADCSSLTQDALATYTVAIQLLAQLRSQDAVDLIKSGTVTYDPDTMESTLRAMKGLAAVPGLGDPSPDADFYLGANDKARAILAVDGPVPQSMFDDLSAYEGDVGAFLGHQLSLNAAASEDCK